MNSRQGSGRTIFFLYFFVMMGGRCQLTSTGVGVTGVEILGRVGVRTVGMTKHANTQGIRFISFAVGVETMRRGVF